MGAVVDKFNKIQCSRRDKLCVTMSTVINLQVTQKTKLLSASQKGLLHGVRLVFDKRSFHWFEAGFDPRQRQKIFPVTSASRPALEPIQPPVQWMPGVRRGWGVMLTAHPLLVPRLRRVGAVPPVPMCQHEV
jgi:hypothetical protein